MNKSTEDKSKSDLSLSPREIIIETIDGSPKNAQEKSKQQN